MSSYDAAWCLRLFLQHLLIVYLSTVVFTCWPLHVIMMVYSCTLYIHIVLSVFQGAAVGVRVLRSASRLHRQILRLSAAAEGKWSQNQWNRFLQQMQYKGGKSANIYRACCSLSEATSVHSFLRVVHMLHSCVDTESIILFSGSGFLHFPELNLKQVDCWYFRFMVRNEALCSWTLCCNGMEMGGWHLNKGRHFGHFAEKGDGSPPQLAYTCSSGF